MRTEIEEFPCMLEVGTSLLVWARYHYDRLSQGGNTSLTLLTLPHPRMSLVQKGHMEFFLCDAADLEDPVNGVVTQECFNMHPLDRAADDDYNSPVDLNFPGRYYGKSYGRPH